MPDIFGVWKSYVQIFLSDLLSSFYLNENYEYNDPMFSWEIPVALTAIAFPESKFGGYERLMFVGDCNNGNIYKFELDKKREKLIFEEEHLQDLILNKKESNSEILFGQGFGCISDIKFKNNNMYVISLTKGIIYKISPE